MGELKTLSEAEQHHVVDQVRLILQSRGIQYEVLPEGVLKIDYGSAETIISFRWSAGETVILVSSRVLEDLSIDDALEFRILRSLNDRNRTLPFGKFMLDRESASVSVEYEILGDHLQDPEFMTALSAVAVLADDHDDLLQQEFGTGRKAAERRGRPDAIRSF